LKYELWISETYAFLTADPERPLQGLPYFEISLQCTDLAPLERRGMPTGIGIFAAPLNTLTSLRFSITRRHDGNISLSGVWDGLIASHTTPPPRP
jgi:hypothetical protein